jgi:hypothetical protein
MTKVANATKDPIVEPQYSILGTYPSDRLARRTRTMTSFQTSLTPKAKLAKIWEKANTNEWLMASARLPGLRDWVAKIGPTWAVTCFYMLQSPRVVQLVYTIGTGSGFGVAAMKKGAPSPGGLIVMND